MTFELSEVVPWGRNFSEYVAMFGLSAADLAKRILGCADGPASFNCEARERGLQVVSADPIFAFPASQIRARIDATSPLIAQQLKDNPGEFVWNYFPDPDSLIAARMRAMERFLLDYPAAAALGRYIEAALPRLPFQDRQFDLALCSHFLFLYSAQFDLQFHRAALAELCRVADEVRIFPLLELGSVPSRHLEAAIADLRYAGHEVERISVPYEVQRGANQVLRIRPRRPAAD